MTTPTPASEWFITTDFFVNGGKIVDGWGPFSTREIALRVRELVEAMPRNRSLHRTFFVDSRPIPMPHRTTP